MSIQAKKEGVIRLIGNILLLFSYIISIVIYLHYLQSSPNLFIIFLISNLVWIFLIVSLKLELDRILSNITSILMIIFTLTIILLILGLISSKEVIQDIIWTLIILNCLSEILCWNFSLSIFKIKKKIFILCFLIAEIIYLVIGYLLYGVYNLHLLILIPVIFSFIAILFIIIAELRMKKRGFLNYL